MNISINNKLQFSIDKVYTAMRDHMPELADFMPNVKSIEVVKRTEQGDSIHILNRWTPAATEVPTIARPFIDPAKTNWLDHAVWNNGQYICNWKLEMGFMTERIQCSGMTAFKSLGENQTQMSIQGTLDLNLKGLVPRFLLSKATKAIESFVGKLVEPNFQKTVEALVQYLKNQQG